MFDSMTHFLHSVISKLKYTYKHVNLCLHIKEDVLTMYEDMAKFLLHTAYTIDSKDALTESSELIKKAER